MPLSSSGWRTRVLLLLVLTLPVLAGAAYPTSDRGERKPSVAVVQDAGSGKPGSAGARFVAELTAAPDFDWRVGTADEVAADLTDGELVAAVHVPAAFDTPAARENSADRTVLVTPGHAELDAATYAALVQSVSAGASRVGVNDLLVSVSRARTNLDIASVTAAGIRSAAEQADATFTDALASVNQLMTQAGPLMASAQTLLGAIQDNVGVVDDIAGQLEVFAAGMRGVDVTLTDLRAGLDQGGAGLDAAGEAVTATAAVRGQLHTVLLPIADALRASGIPDAQRMADQLTGLVAVAGGAADEQATAGLRGLRVGAELLSTQLADLSGLLGVPVSGQCRISDVLTLAVNRLRMVSALLRDGERTITDVLGQLGQAQDQLPGMQDQITTQLTQFKQVTAQLVTTLDNGVRGLPTRSDVTARAVSDSVRLGESDGLTSEDLVHAVVWVLLAAMAIAAVRAWWVERRPRAGLLPNVPAALVAGGVGLVGALLLDESDHVAAVFAILTLTSLACTALAVALGQLAGRAGMVVMAVLVGAAAIFGGGYRDLASDSDFVRRLLPSSYAVTALGDAAHTGIDGALILPVAVLLAVGVVSVCCTVFVSRRAQS